MISTRAKRDKDREYFREMLGEGYMRDKIVEWDILTGTLRCTLRQL